MSDKYYLQEGNQEETLVKVNKGYFGMMLKREDNWDHVTVVEHTLKKKREGLIESKKESKFILKLWR